MDWFQFFLLGFFSQFLTRSSKHFPFSYEVPFCRDRREDGFGSTNSKSGFSSLPSDSYIIQGVYFPFSSDALFPGNRPSWTVTSTNSNSRLLGSFSQFFVLRSTYFLFSFEVLSELARGKDGRISSNSPYFDRGTFRFRPRFCRDRRDEMFTSTNSNSSSFYSSPNSPYFDRGTFRFRPRFCRDRRDEMFTSTNSNSSSCPFDRMRSRNS
jgi:hypothetical protein